MVKEKQDLDINKKNDHDQQKAIEVVEDEISFSDYKWEDWITLVLFWILNIAVFYQFFTRYVLENSAAWTEEISRYLLIAVTFIGSAMCVRKNTHIHLEFLYKFIPKKVGRVLATIIDIIRILFIGYATYLSIVLLPITSKQRMVMFNFSMGWVFLFVTFGFLLMTFRSIQLAIVHWRRGWSILESNN